MTLCVSSLSRFDSICNRNHTKYGMKRQTSILLPRLKRARLHLIQLKRFSLLINLETRENVLYFSLMCQKKKAGVRLRLAAVYIHTQMS